MGWFSDPVPENALNWERIISSTENKTKLLAYHQIYRSKVPGGWLVTIGKPQITNNTAMLGITFLPDPNHSWEIETTPKMIL